MEINTEVNPTQQEFSKSKSKKTLGQDAFLKLLITQIKHQDPTEPMKASEQVAQLAVFSQMEQSVQMNSTLQELLKSNNLAQASSYIGKNITNADGSISGVVNAIQVSSTGLTAITVDNTEIPITTGIRISN
ncbi:flagellar hook assembly protein FlgD [Candidatus Liberibacter asiaticus]|uniref:Basal-body rod modification protein FlgD n=2 Tax=Liberibacter asiaticus TaxID=34021 RepID=C6XF41_LIBAP|nr:flagellar hook assembly protein FlgD [Candidatus Liberibacter asiaticus]ACT56993.1 flagellar basal body rod modification protein [Candidatus Liberibacter asiaticus str. psy62]ALK07368.1 flagellar hook assembly protein FlgD [Candidatus Liberibacter asiaticus]ASK52860.1 flagellar biosynthesis protein FlgD [Candidatus Liberibacter asiaticus]AWL14178.1 flagellar biosynthesis protein FlgD [Candidatus Liberibacter asiaticus]KAE9510771.1 Basal-body rod modification protein FlgD [Candidatus Liberib